MEKSSAVLMSADVNDAGRLAGMSGDVLAALLATCRTEILEHVVRFGGRAHIEQAEGLLARFTSADQAARCAMAAQRGLVRLSLERTDIRRLGFRFGLVVGEVAEIEGDLLGAGVAMAHKLQTMAPEGGIAVSRSFREAMGADLPAVVERAGMVEFKGGLEPTEIYFLTPRTAASRPGGARPSRQTPALPLMKRLVTGAKAAGIALVVGATCAVSVSAFVGGNLMLIHSLSAAGTDQTQAKSKPVRVAVQRDEAVAPKAGPAVVRDDVPAPGLSAPSEKTVVAAVPATRAPVDLEPVRAAEAAPVVVEAVSPKAASVAPAPAVPEVVAEAAPEPPFRSGGKKSRKGADFKIPKDLTRLAEQFLDCGRCGERDVKRRIESLIGRF